MVSGNKQTSRTFLQMLALSIHYLELKSDCKQLFCDHMAAEFGAQRFYLCFVAFNTHTDTQTHAYTSLRFGVLDPGRQVALFGNAVCKLRGGALIILMLSAERWRFFFFFFFAMFLSWSAHSAGIVIRPVSCGRRLLSASPPLSRLPLFPGSNNGFFSASLYICALFALVCSVCFVLLSAVFFFPPAVELGNNTYAHNPELICSSSLWFKPLSLNLSPLQFSAFLPH